MSSKKFYVRFFMLISLILETFSQVDVGVVMIAIVALINTTNIKVCMFRELSRDLIKV